MKNVDKKILFEGKGCDVRIYWDQASEVAVCRILQNDEATNILTSLA